MLSLQMASRASRSGRSRSKLCSASGPWTTEGGGGSVGDTLTLTLLNLAPHSDTAFVSVTLSQDDLGDPQSLRDQFLAAINATAGITQGEGAEVGSVAFLSAVASGTNGFALNPDEAWAEGVYRLVATNTLGRSDGSDLTFIWRTNRPSLATPQVLNCYRR